MVLVAGAAIEEHHDFIPPGKGYESSLNSAQEAAVQRSEHRRSARMESTVAASLITASIGDYRTDNGIHSTGQRHHLGRDSPSATLYRR